MTRTNDWFQYRDFDLVTKAVRALTRSAEHVLSYGSSMGGYGAIRFADAVGATQVLAFSPQYSIDRRVMPQEIRWGRPNVAFGSSPE
jgi:S-formylglutathione hydrolase FrmB